MMFDDWQAFILMGGHGLYVWLAYGVALGLLILNLVRFGTDRRRTLRLLRPQTDKPNATEAP